jgi:hypothetical protein
LKRPPHADEPLWRADGSASFEPPPVHIATDAAGRFHADSLRATGYALRIEAPGSAVVEKHIEPVNDAFEPITLHLSSSASITGEARFDDGSPAASVRFECQTRDGQVVAESDALGAFRIEGLQAGRVTVEARAGGIGPLTRAELDVSSDRATTWNPTVAHPETIEGRALGADGRPVRTWLVLAVPEATVEDDPADALARWSHAYVPADPDAMLLQCYLDPQGQFVVPCRSGSTHRIELRPRAAWQGDVLAIASGVRAGARNVELRMKRDLGGFQGRFVDAHGKPVPMTLVLAVPRDMTAETRAPVDAASGRFEMKLMPGRYDLLALGARGAPWQIGRFELPGNTPLDLGDQVVPDPGRIEVETQGARGSTVELESERGLRIEMQQESTKLWIARELQPGRYHVRMTRPEGARVEREVEVIANETARVLIQAE